MIGRTLGHYQVVEQLGAGGMGIVYLARDERLGRDVAVKVLPEELAADPERLARFEREAKALAALSHPHIVTIYSVEEAEGVRFLTMEFVEGETLERSIPAGGMALERFLEVAAALAEALAAAHAHGVLHRDLKPGNVMVTPEGRVKVLDFGLAKLAGEPAESLMEVPTETLEALTREGRIVGTVPYMAPEQLRGRPVDARSDLFSLGVVLYQMATGRRPFQGESSVEVLSSILRDEPASVIDLRPEMPRQLGRILRRCLAKDPERRFQSAKDLRNELEALREELSETSVAEGLETGRHQGVGARRPLEPGRMPLTRHWALLGSAGVVVLAVAAIVLIAIGGRERPTAARESSEITSLAVLPLTNLMRDPEEDYFVDGMHEAITAELAKIGALKVISRTSAMRFRGTDKAMPQIARELKVDGLIEGSVLRDGGQVRITVQLIHGPSDRHLWTESYQRGLRDVLALQSDVARAIANEVRVALTPEDEQRLAARGPIDPKVYELWLKGNFHSNRLTEQSLRRALGFYQAAIAMDPDYAPAHAGLARSYILLGSWVASVAPLEVLARARQAVERALALDPDLASAHVALAMIRFWFDWDWEGAERAFSRAIELNPNETGSYSLFLAVMGRFEESIELSRHTLEHNPLSPGAYFDLAGLLSLAGNDEEALDVFHQGFELDPHHWQGHLVMNGFYYASRGELAMALSHLERAMAIQETARTMGWLGYLHASAGRRAEALAVVDHLMERREQAYTYQEAEALAFVHIGLGNHDDALRWLETAYENREMGLVWLKEFWVFDPLRDDPRFQDLLRRMSFSG